MSRLWVEGGKRESEQGVPVCRASRRRGLAERSPNPEARLSFTQAPALHPDLEYPEGEGPKSSTTAVRARWRDATSTPSNSFAIAGYDLSHALAAAKTHYHLSICSLPSKLLYPALLPPLRRPQLKSPPSSPTPHAPHAPTPSSSSSPPCSTSSTSWALPSLGGRKRAAAAGCCRSGRDCSSRAGGGRG